MDLRGGEVSISSTKYVSVSIIERMVGGGMIGKEAEAF